MTLLLEAFKMHRVPLATAHNDLTDLKQWFVNAVRRDSISVLQTTLDHTEVLVAFE